jgi:hypothetical protein
MALSVVVFDVGETLVDEATTYERWEAEGITTFVFEDRDLYPDALPCFDTLRARGLGIGDNDVGPALAAGLRDVRIRRGAHAAVESPAGTVTIGSLDELPRVLPDG